MNDKWVQAAQGLADDERERALANVLENVNEPEAGVIRQLLAAEKKPLTEKQYSVYKNHVEPLLVEKCGGPGCGNFSIAGETYCSVCEIEYGP